MIHRSISGNRAGQVAMRAWVLLGTVSLATCSDGKKSGNADGGAGAALVPSNSFATTFASTFCDSIAACCRQAGYDPSSCQSTLAPSLTAAINVRLSDSRVAFDEAAGGRCLAVVRAALTACTHRDLANQNDNTCNGIFRGTVAMGGSCGDSSHCIQPATGSAVCVSGVCTASPDSSTLASPWNTPPGAAGEPCGGTCTGRNNYSYSCSGGAGDKTGANYCWTEDGLYCASGVCAALPLLRQACGGGSDCATDSTCQSGICVAAAATGPCTDDTSCLSTSYCDYSAQLCTPLKPDGQSCASSRECSGGQCDQYRCRSWSMATAAACAGLLD